MQYRILGRTGERVSAIGLGGSHLGLPHVDEQLSLRIVRRAIDEGLTFLDNAWDYNGGASETRMGKALRDGYREKVFLMTKIDGRSKRRPTRQLDESLGGCRPITSISCSITRSSDIDDPHRIFDEEGANAALIEAKQSGQGPIHRLHGPQGSPRFTFICSTWRARHGFVFDTVRCR